MPALAARAVELTESGLLPDPLVRHGIRHLIRGRLSDLDRLTAGRQCIDSFVSTMDDSPVALLPHLANEQHYEVPAVFFEHVLGTYRKYSCCYWSEQARSLSEAEEAALRQTCRHAAILDGMHVLDLGCGWGSLTLWIAANYPNCKVTAVSNSMSQREFIAGEAQRRGLANVRVVVADMNDFTTDDLFDRVVSIEMFEHMRNYRELFRRISGWMKPDGFFLMHIFCHRSTPYEFLDKGPGDWMSRHFFSGGIMPSDDLPLRFQDDLRLQQRWRWSGLHYAKTATAWLRNMDNNKAALMPVLATTYGEGEAKKWWMRWRLFFMACGELFNYNHGREWWVSHYRFIKRSA